MAQRVPEGYQSVVPYLAVDDAKKAIEFYKRAFGATERLRMPGPNDTIGHCELQIGDAVVMLADPFPQAGVQPPAQVGGTTIGLFMYVEDVDEAVQNAADAGGEVVQAPEDQFWGDRFGQVKDPFGHYWQIATHIEDVSPEEIQRRTAEFAASLQQG